VIKLYKQLQKVNKECPFSWELREVLRFNRREEDEVKTGSRTLVL
jgi:hypothetical protein